MRISVLALVATTIFSGCAAVHVQRKIVNEKGVEVGTVDITHAATSVDGAVEILNGTRQYEETAQGGDIASQGIARGLPVALQTQGANVAVGNQYPGYGNGYYGNGYAQADPMLVYGERLTFERAARSRVVLPPLNQGPAPTGYPQQTQTLPTLTGGGLEPCPPGRDPATQGERLTCTEQEVQHLTNKVWNNK